MKKPVRKLLIAGLLALAVAPALAGCVAEIGPGYYHRPCCGWYGHYHYHDWR